MPRLALALSMSACAADPYVVDAPSPPPATGSGYYVQANTVYNADGTPHVFRGVSRPSLEWDPAGDSLSAADHQRIASWGANVVRIPLTQSFWLADSAYHDASYRARIDQNVAWANAAGLDVILDLHRSDRGDRTLWPQQQRMADQRSVQFWSEVAAGYRNNPRVLFELYNEPHDVSWPVWRDGGASGDGFQVAGMQQLYDAVRAAGANNLVIAGGLDFAYDLRGVPQYRLAGNNIVYASHPYRPYATKVPSQWPMYWGFLADTDPIVLTEFGDVSGNCSADYNSSVIAYAEQHGVSWIGWAWYPSNCAFPSLIADWSGAPTVAGQVVHDALEEKR
jgi:hypothetical protein